MRLLILEFLNPHDFHAYSGTQVEEGAIHFIFQIIVKCTTSDVISSNISNISGVDIACGFGFIMNKLHEAH